MTEPISRVVARDSNRPYGHIALGHGGQATADLIEDRDRLGLWVTETTWLDPDSARDLAAELCWWADRRDHINAAIVQTAGQGDLFGEAS